jgi:hypothetical protein
MLIFFFSYLVALSLEQEQGQAAGSDVWTDADVATLSEYVSWTFGAILS